MRTDSHANCICAGGDFMPTEVDFTCGCFIPSWLSPDEWTVQEGCDHPMAEFELVCRTHKKHFPCRPCLREEGVVH